MKATNGIISQAFKWVFSGTVNIKVIWIKFSSGWEDVFICLFPG